MKKLIVIMLVIIGLAFLVLLEINNKMTPTVRNNISKPIYTIGDKNYELALIEKKKTVKFGPMFFGLYSGGLAFASVEEVAAYMQKNKWDNEKWGIYLLSGDYDRDVKQGHTNKSLLVIQQVKQN